LSFGSWLSEGERRAPGGHSVSTVAIERRVTLALFDLGIASSAVLSGRFAEREWPDSNELWAEVGDGVKG